VITVLVNGAAVTRIVLRQGEEGEEGEKQKDYFLDIRSEDQRTVLATDGKDKLWIYGQVRCTDPEVNTDALTQSLGFTPGGPNASWLRLGEPQMKGGFKAVLARAYPPTPEADLQPGGAFVTVGTLIENRNVSGNLDLELLPEYYLEFKEV
jgi:hypothetical protein